MSDSEVVPDAKASPTAAFRTSLASFSYQGDTSSRPAPRRSPRKHSSDAPPPGSETPPVTPSKRRRTTNVKDERGSAKKKKRTPVKRGYASPEKYAHLRGLQDHLGMDLDVMFCGINPGCMSAEKGHHFANPTNHFWRALHQGGFVPQFVPPDDDHTLPEAYNLGLTNLVERPSAEAGELSAAEMVASVPTFLTKIVRYRPRIVCFVGKGIWLAVQKSLDVQLRNGLAPKAEPAEVVRAEAEEIKDALDDEENTKMEELTAIKTERTPGPRKSPSKKKDTFEYGVQPYVLVLPAQPLPQSPRSPQMAESHHGIVDDTSFTANAQITLVKQEEGSSQLPPHLSTVTRTLISVMPSTSGRVTSHQLTDKIVLFGQLKRDSDSIKAGTFGTAGFKTVHI